jgi:hypothetical protein
MFINKCVVDKNITYCRAINFASYNKGKRMLKEANGGVESSLVHLGAAACAGLNIVIILYSILMTSPCRNYHSNSNKSYLGCQDSVATAVRCAQGNSTNTLQQLGRLLEIYSTPRRNQSIVQRDIRILLGY